MIVDWTMKHSKILLYDDEKHLTKCVQLRVIPCLAKSLNQKRLFRRIVCLVGCVARGIKLAFCAKLISSDYLNS